MVPRSSIQCFSFESPIMVLLLPHVSPKEEEEGDEEEEEKEEDEEEAGEQMG